MFVPSMWFSQLHHFHLLLDPPCPVSAHVFQTPRIQLGMQASSDKFVVSGADPHDIIRDIFSEMGKLLQSQTLHDGFHTSRTPLD